MCICDNCVRYENDLKVEYSGGKIFKTESFFDLYHETSEYHKSKNAVVTTPSAANIIKKCIGYRVKSTGAKKLPFF